MYVYICSEDWREDGVRHRLWTVGFYKPDGKFEPESDHDNKDVAAARVHWLNGGIPEYELNELATAASMWAGMHR